MIDFFFLWMDSVWKIIAASAPWLLVGFLVAGFLHQLVPAQLIQKHLLTPGLRSVIKASLFGIPLPLCSCSVIPVAASLRRAGASRGATAGFLVSAPEIGVDSFALTVGLLGWPVAIARVVTAFVSALVVGLSVDSFVIEDKRDLSSEVKACCANSGPVASQKMGNIIVQAFNYGFVIMLGDLAKLLAFGFLIAGLISAAIPNDFLTNLNVPYPLLLLSILLFSLPMYICATSSTPLAAIFLAKGVTPGAVLLFLLAGAATNVATILVVDKELGRKATVIYVGGIVVISIVCAVFLDLILWHYGVLISADSIALAHDHGANHTMVNALAGYIFVGLLAVSFLKTMRRG